jgi:hypothetical protein
MTALYAIHDLRLSAAGLWAGETLSKSLSGDEGGG